MSGDLFEHVDRAAIRAALADARGLHEHARRVVASLEAVLGERDDLDDPARMDFSDRERWLTIQEAAHIRQCSTDTIRRNIERYGQKHDGRWWIDRLKLMRGRE